MALQTSAVSMNESDFSTLNPCKSFTTNPKTTKVEDGI